jgi:Rrf2 family transcriptional regulator, iron-sulfur cluster assembly transcription factor
MSLLSKSCVYGLRAVLYVAGFGADRKFVPIREISSELGISFHFLTKILQQLTGSGLLESYRGPHGGIALARHPAKISMLDVVKAIDSGSLFESCVLGLAECSGDHPCPLHETWGAQRAELASALKRTTLAMLRDPVLRKEMLLCDPARRTRARKR